MRKVIILSFFLILFSASFGQLPLIKTYYVEFMNFPSEMKKDIESRFINKTTSLKETHIKIINGNEELDSSNELHKFEPFTKSNENKDGIIKIRVKYSIQKLPSPETYRGNFMEFYTIEHFLFDKNKWRRILKMDKIEILPYELETINIGNAAGVLQKVANTIILSTYK